SLVEYPFVEDKKLLNVDINSLYLNFNYTDTLESYYGVNSESINYIHGNINNEDNDTEIVLGHAVNLDSVDELDMKKPDNLSLAEEEEWESWKNDQYDFSVELGKEVVRSYFNKTFKNTKKIIDENKNFFLSLKEVTEIVIVGHSLSDVDLPYIEKIKQCVDLDAKWKVTYYGDTEKIKHEKTLTKLQIVNFEVIRISDL
ncbi:AbiH family protein, partial [Pseudomonas sp. F1_0610]|uniref:AbiH family protein n=1 Tax=Pseudomonas sp. F1_0610 TaxID=3114284 RepID=UPI0039C29E77